MKHYRNISRGIRNIHTKNVSDTFPGYSTLFTTTLTWSRSLCTNSPQQIYTECIVSCLIRNIDWPSGMIPSHIPPTSTFVTSNPPNVLQIPDSNATTRCNSHISGNRSTARSQSFAITLIMNALHSRQPQVFWKLFRQLRREAQTFPRTLRANWHSWWRKTASIFASTHRSGTLILL